MFKKPKETYVGFTLVELIIVISLIGVLSAIALPKFANLQSGSQVNFVNGVINALTIGRERWLTAWLGVTGGPGVGANDLSTYYMSFPLTNSSTTTSPATVSATYQYEYFLRLNSSGYPVGAPIIGDILTTAAAGYTGFTFNTNNNAGTRTLSTAGTNEIAVMCARIFFNLINNPNISVGHSSSYTTDFLYDSTCNVANTPSTKSAFCVVPGAGYSSSTQCYYQYQGNTAIHILYTPSTGVIVYNG